MGHWGIGILQNDTSAEKLELYLELLDNAVSHDDALANLQKDHALEFEDPETALDAWVGIAEARWQMGALDAATRATVTSLAADEASYAAWADAGAKELAARRKAIAKFLVKLESAPKRIRSPKKPRVIPETPAIFSPGDCLAAKLDSGKWCALLVVRQNRIEPWHKKFILHEDVIYQIGPPQTDQPTITAFEQRGEVAETRTGGDRTTPSFVSMNPKTFTREIAPRVLKIGQVQVRSQELHPTPASGMWHHFLQFTQ